MSAVKSILVAALVSVGFAGAAFAAGGSVYTVRLAAPLAEQTRVIALNTIWTCEGDTCRARPNHGANVRSCRQFVRQSGARVVAYGAPGDELTADEITRCNRDAPAM
ncbi:MAG: hypothetical protein R3C25_04020 [Hyphomonadaceae bacterium]